MSTDESERWRLKKEWGRIQVKERCYVRRKLGEKEENGYFAAGICPFLQIHDPDTGKSELSMLLVEEIRNGFVKLNFLGGKRELGEFPDDTSCREFLEETCGLLEEEKGRLKRLIGDKKNQRLWLNEGRYVLISLSSPDDWLKLPSRFSRLRKERGLDDTGKTEDREFEVEIPDNRHRVVSKELTSDKQLKTKGLIWVPVRDLGGSIIKPQLSHFLKSIFQLSEFEEFVNGLPFNPEVYEIAKHFEAQKWITTCPQKRNRENSFYDIYSSPYKRRLNYSWGSPSRYRDFSYHDYRHSRAFYTYWGR